VEGLSRGCRGEGALSSGPYRGEKESLGGRGGRQIQYKGERMILLIKSIRTGMVCMDRGGLAIN